MLPGPSAVPPRNASGRHPTQRQGAIQPRSPCRGAAVWIAPRTEAPASTDSRLAPPGSSPSGRLRKWLRRSSATESSDRLARRAVRRRPGRGRRNEGRPSRARCSAGRTAGRDARDRRSLAARLAPGGVGETEVAPTSSDGAASSAPRSGPATPAAAGYGPERTRAVVFALFGTVLGVHGIRVRMQAEAAP